MLLYLSCRSALMSTYTVVGSGPEVPCSQSQHGHGEHVTIDAETPSIQEEADVRCSTCRQMARFTLQPNAVLTERGWRPRSLKSLEKEYVRDILGRSSATTTQARTRDKSSPRAWNRITPSTRTTEPAD